MGSLLLLHFVILALMGLGLTTGLSIEWQIPEPPPSNFQRLRDTLVMYLIAYPVAIVWLLSEYPVDHWQSRKEQRAAVPRSIPKRRRALSRTSSRSGLGIFGKLPYEIRRIIFVEVLRGQVLHIDNPKHLPRRLAHYRCTGLSQSAWRQSDKIDKCGNGTMGLLKACRASYKETVVLLYTTTTFAIDGWIPGIKTFLYFCRSIRPWRLASITNLYVHSIAGIAEPLIQRLLPCWIRLWDVVTTKMTSLKHLTLHLSLSLRLPLPSDEAWVKPILQVRGLTTFDLKLNGQVTLEAEDYYSGIQTLKERLGERICTKRKTSKSSALQEVDRRKNRRTKLFTNKR